MPVPSQGHYGFHSFPVVDWFCLFIYFSLCKIARSSVILLLPLCWNVLKMNYCPAWKKTLQLLLPWDEESSSWSSSYGSTRYNIMWYCWLSLTCDRSVVFSEYTGFPHQSNWLPRYNWNIVESGVKHDNTNLNPWSNL